MSKIKKFFLGLSGVAVLLLALYLATFVFVAVLIFSGIAAIYLKFKMKKVRKEFAEKRADLHSRVFDGEYVVHEEHSVDVKPDQRR